MRKPRFLAFTLALCLLFSDASVAFANDVSSNSEYSITDYSVEEEVPSLEEAIESYVEDAVVSSEQELVEHETIYLSEETYLSLAEETQEAYDALCTELNDAGAENLVFATDSEGNLYYSFTASMLDFSEYDSLFDLSDVSANEAKSDVSSNDVSSNDVSSNDDISDEEEVIEEDVAEEEQVSDVSDNDVIDEASEEESDEHHFISENMEFLFSFEEEVEEEESFEEEDYDSLTSCYKKDYYRSLLNSNEKTVYDAAKKKLLNCKSNRFSFSVSGYSTSLYNIYTGLSALQHTYPTKTDWIAKGKNSKASYSGVYDWGTRRSYFTVTISKSKHYNSKLKTQAENKVKQVVEEAYNYASSRSSSNTTYNVIAYLDNWLCANNYYDNRGVESTSAGSYEYNNMTNVYYNCHTSYGCLLNGYGVCESYAKAMCWFLDVAGISHLYCTSPTHAYIYVLMSDGKWYMLDSTWNDTTEVSHNYSSKAYLLSAADSNSNHYTTNRSYASYCRNLTVPTLSTTKYSGTESISLSKGNLVLAKGKTSKLSLTTNAAYKKYYDTYQKKWASSNTAVAKVDSKGKVTAVAPGYAQITCTIDGVKLGCSVYVYQLTGLTVNSTGKSKTSLTYIDSDAVFSGTETDYITVTVGQKNETLTAQKLTEYSAISNPTVSSSKKSVATVSLYQFSGDTIKIKVNPKATGKTDITVKYGGKTAKITYSVKKQIQTNWFDYSNITAKTYNGKSQKPAIKKTTYMPKGVTYSVKYTNNVNAGTATVTISGSNNYAGSIVKTFVINKAPGFENAKLTYNGVKTYNGTSNPASVTLKLGKKTLKKGVDYNVQYYVSGYWTTTAPTNAGSYVVVIRGLNYSGKDISTSLTINKVAVNKAVSVKSTYTYNNKPAKVLTVKAGGKKVPTDQYTVKYYLSDGKTLYGDGNTAPKKTGTYYVKVTFKSTNFSPYMVDGVNTYTVTKKFKIVKQ